MRILLQFQILEKLVLWFLEAYPQHNTIQINKYGNLLTILVSKLNFVKE